MNQHFSSRQKEEMKRLKDDAKLESSSSSSSDSDDSEKERKRRKKKEKKKGKKAKRKAEKKAKKKEKKAKRTKHTCSSERASINPGIDELRKTMDARELFELRNEIRGAQGSTFQAKLLQEKKAKQKVENQRLVNEINQRKEQAAIIAAQEQDRLEQESSNKFSSMASSSAVSLLMKQLDSVDGSNGRNQMAQYDGSVRFKM